jgi:hypothetical protein
MGFLNTLAPADVSQHIPSEFHRSPFVPGLEEVNAYFGVQKTFRQLAEVYEAVSWRGKPTQPASAGCKCARCLGRSGRRGYSLAGNCHRELRLFVRAALPPDRENCAFCSFATLNAQSQPPDKNALNATFGRSSNQSSCNSFYSAGNHLTTSSALQ